MRQQRILGGVAILVAGLALPVFSLSRTGQEGVALAQATPQPPQAAQPSQRDDQPAESKPGGTRPTTPAPEPARPANGEGSTTGSSPPITDDRSPDRPPAIGTPLPPAPAEKIAPPMQRK